jgi:hypothetical protein
VNGGNIIVDSSDAKGGTISNSGDIVADNLYFTGTPGYNTSNSGQFIAQNGKIYSNQATTPDPLSGLAAPPVPSLVYANVNISGLPKSGGSVPGWPDPSNANGWILPAASYKNGIHISDNDPSHTYTFQSGLFYFFGGGLSLSGSAKVNCESSGVCLYFRSGGGMSITAGGSVTLSPLKSGPYENITIFEDRANTSQNSLTGQVGGSLNISGTVYTPAAKFTITGSGGNYALGSQYIVYQLSVTGSGTFNVNYTGLAAPNRDLYLTE